MDGLASPVALTTRIGQVPTFAEPADLILPKPKRVQRPKLRLATARTRAASAKILPTLKV